jgi:hypothetical protein
VAETTIKKLLCCAAGFDALVKRWDTCISVGGGYVEKQTFFPGSNITFFYVLYPFVTYLLTLPRNNALHIFVTSNTAENYATHSAVTCISETVFGFMLYNILDLIS